MKKVKTLLVLVSVFVCSHARSQDIITLKNGDEIKCKVSEINTTEVKYKRSDSSPLIVINKSEIFMIKYEDGTKDTFKESAPTEDMFTKGRNDAEKYYKGKKSGAGGTLITSFIGGALIGLIPAIACSTTPPKAENLALPDKSLESNDSYMRGYTEKAHKIKRGRVWTSYAVGAILGLVTYLALIES